jgi:anti-sigma regulatory factor (Ser/Thr protein kinase)
VEVIAGSFHQVFPIDDVSRVGEVRRHAASLATSLNWGEVDAGRLALVVTELGTNLLRYAVRGRLLVTARPDLDEVEVVSIDNGPGIAQLDQCLRDGYSSGSTPGTGLGTIKRQAQDFDIHSSIPGGTVAVARVRRRAQRVHPIVVGAVSIAAPGENVCGDGWAVCLDASGGALMVADGLGHGPDAHVAAQAALEVFKRDPFAPLSVSLQEAHREVRTTRGAAVLSLRFDLSSATVRSAGAGNVLARLVSGVTDRTLLCQHGTVGVQIRRIEEASVEWPPHALLIVHTDGIEARWSKDLLMPLLDRDPALVAAVLLRDHCRGRDDASIVVVGRRAL